MNHVRNGRRKPGGKGLLWPAIALPGSSGQLFVLFTLQEVGDVDLAFA